MKLPQRQDQMFSRLMSRQGQLPPRKIAPNPELTLTQTLTGEQFSSEAIVSLPPKPPKTKPNLHPNPKSNRGSIFLRGEGGN